MGLHPSHTSETSRYYVKVNHSVQLAGLLLHQAHHAALAIWPSPLDKSSADVMIDMMTQQKAIKPSPSIGVGPDVALF